MTRLVLLAVLVVVAAVGSIALGRYPLPLGEVLAVIAARLSGGEIPATAGTVVLSVRLPRVVAAMAIGAGLSLAGASYQSLFRNPMASPALLGVSAGAGFGAALALLLHQPSLVVQAAAFAGGLLAVGASVWANRVLGGRSMVTLVLCGMVMAALFQALISVVKYLADPVDILASITFWLMGSLSRISAADASTVGTVVAVCGALLFALRWRINLLSLGEHDAAALGVEVGRLRLVVIVCATLITAATVSVGGIIGWVGLIIPHLARMVFGLDPDRLVPGTALLGALYLLLVDDLARTAGAIEVPLGILTALVGAPVFLALLARTQRGHWS